MYVTFLAESVRYEYKTCLKLLISLRPYHSHTCNSLLSVPQRTQTDEATIKRATWPMDADQFCMPPNQSTDAAVRSIHDCAEPYSAFGSVQDPVLENRMSLVRCPARPIFLPKTDDSLWGRIHSSLAAVHCFDNGNVGKQPVAWKEYCAEYGLRELQECMGSGTGRRNITEILFKTALNTIQSINYQ